MKRKRLKCAVVVIVCSLVGAGPIGAAHTRRMNLHALYENADRVFRGTVVEITDDLVEVGGGRLPIIRYRIRVNESFQGSSAAGSEIEIRMLDPKAGASPSNGSARVLPLFDGLPQLAVGSDYLLFMTRPSAVGLSTTVGLGQGCFHVRTGRETTVVNELDNVGLFRDMAPTLPARGPMSYSRLANEIRRLRTR